MGVARQRADATLVLTVARLGDSTRPVGIREAGSARLRLPRADGRMLEAVTINTGGGIAEGDRFSTAIDVGSRAELLVTTASAEKAYRSDGDTAEIAAAIRIAADARLEWLPQETILFDQARVRRSLDVDLDRSGSALLFEATVFGRAAFGETVSAGFYEDRWRIRRDRRLVYVDTLRIRSGMAERLARRTGLGGARAFATLLYVAPDAESRIDGARAGFEGAGSECGASAWNGMLLARFLAPDIETLRRDAARFITLFRGRPMPRVWQT